MDLQLEYKDGLYKTQTDGGGKIILLRDGSPPESFTVIRTESGYAVETGSGLHPAMAARNGDTIWVRFAGRTYRLNRSRGRKRAGSRSAGDLSSPMPGQVQKLLVKEGDAVEAHQPLLVIEAMKMQLEIKAPYAGRVKRLLAREGDQVEAGSPLAELETTE